MPAFRVRRTTAAVCAVLAFAGLAPAARAVSGTQRVAVPVNKLAATDTNLAVDLGQVSKKILSAADKYGNSVPIEIHLTGCNFGTPTTGMTYPSGSKVAIKFPGQTGTDGMIPNTLGNAQNVSIQLLQANGTSKVNFDAGDPGTQMVDGANTLSFFARIAATAAGVTAGTVSSKVTYMLDYK